MRRYMETYYNGDFDSDLDSKNVRKKTQISEVATSDDFNSEGHEPVEKCNPKAHPRTKNENRDSNSSPLKFSKHSESGASQQEQIDHQITMEYFNDVHSTLLQTQSDLSQCRLHIQSLESQLRQKDEATQRKERELQLSNEARDQANQEAQRLLSHMEALEVKERSRITSLQTEKEELKAENDKLKRSLESVVFAHSQLQHALELLQTELGEKDTLLNITRKDKEQLLQNEKNFRLEIEIMSKKIAKFEKTEQEQLQPLRHNASSLKKENDKLKELVQHGEVQMQELRTRLTQTEQELIRRKSELDEQKHVMHLDLQQYRAENKSYEDRLEAMREQIVREREHYCKQIEKANSENHQLLEKKQQELNQCNEQLMTLKIKSSDLEESIKESEQTINDLQSLISQYSLMNLSDCKSENASGKNLHEIYNKEQFISDASELEKRVRFEVEEAMKHIKNYQEEIDTLYSEKKLYLERSREQEDTIKSFMQQIESLQMELQKVKRNQNYESCGHCYVDNNEISSFESKQSIIPSGDHPNISYELEYKPTKDKKQIENGSSGDTNDQDSPSRQSADLLANKAQEAILSTRKTMSRLTQYIAAYETKSRRGNTNNHALIIEDHDFETISSNSREALSQTEEELNKCIDQQLREIGIHC